VLLPYKERLPVPTIEAEYTFSFRTAKKTPNRSAIGYSRMAATKAFGGAP
jgi:hypothetical protein